MYVNLRFIHIPLFARWFLHCSTTFRIIPQAALSIRFTSSCLHIGSHSALLSLKAPRRQLAAALSRRSVARNIQVIANARVPIIKFEAVPSGIAFDLSFNVANGPQVCASVCVRGGLGPKLPL